MPLSLPVSAIKGSLTVLSYFVRRFGESSSCRTHAQLSAVLFAPVRLHVFNTRQVQGRACGSQKKAAEGLEWEVTVVVSCRVGAGN